MKVHSPSGTSEIQVDPSWSRKKFSKEVLETKRFRGLMLAPGERLVGLLTKNKSLESVESPYRHLLDEKEQKLLSVEFLDDLPYLQATQVWIYPSESSLEEEVDQLLSIHRQALIQQYLSLKKRSTYHRGRAISLRDQSNRRWSQLKKKLQRSYSDQKKANNHHPKVTKTSPKDKKETKKETPKQSPVKRASKDQSEILNNWKEQV